MPKKTFDHLVEKYKNSGLKYFNPEEINVSNPEQNPYHRWGFKGPEMDQLRESIQENGVFHPIYISKDGYCLSGNRRLVICQELGKLIPGYQFLEDMDNEDERILIHHTNNVQRTLSSSDKKKLVQDRFADIIGAPKSLPMISKLTGIPLETVKKISADAKKKREYDRLGKKLSEEDYKANLDLFRELEKIKGKINHYMKERSRVIKSLEETAPMEVWNRWLKEWEKQKRTPSRD